MRRAAELLPGEAEFACLRLAYFAPPNKWPVVAELVRRAIDSQCTALCINYINAAPMIGFGEIPWP
jgi:hypothetical protein